MKRLFVALCVATLVSGAAFAQGVDKGQFEVSVAPGLSLPMGDFGDISSMGFFGGVNVGLYATPLLVVGAEGSYYMYSPSDDYEAAVKALTGDPNAEVTLSMIQFSAYGKYLFKPQNFSPYVKASFGTYSAKTKIEASSGSGDDSESDLGIAGGAGLQFKGQGNMGGFVEAMYHNVMSDPSTTFINVRAGVTFFFGKK